MPRFSSHDSRLAVLLAASGASLNLVEIEEKSTEITISDRQQRRDQVEGSDGNLWLE